jgi:hypothetical protein
LTASFYQYNGKVPPGTPGAVMTTLEWLNLKASFDVPLHIFHPIIYSNNKTLHQIYGQLGI